MKLPLVALACALVLSARADDLSPEALSDIAGALDIEMLGWQELVVAGLPLQAGEIASLRSLVANHRGVPAARTLAALEMKLGDWDRALAALEPVKDPEQPVKILLWQCELSFLLGRTGDAAGFLNRADTPITPSGMAYHPAEFLPDLTRMAYGMGTLAQHRSWLEWLAARDDHPSLQWQAVRELIDLAYHQGQPFDTTGFPRWMRPAVLLDQSRVADAYDDLQSGKGSWWKPLTVQQQAVLARLFPRSRDLAETLVARLASARDADRTWILGALLDPRTESLPIHLAFMKDRDLFRACLPALLELWAEGLIGSGFAEVAAQEAIARPTDLAAVALALYLQALPRDIQPRVLSRAWRSLDPATLSGLPALEDHPFRGSSPAIQVAIRLASNCRSEEAFQALIASHPQSAAFPAGLIENLGTWNNNGRSVKLPRRKPAPEGIRMLEIRRVLQDFTAPDIGRRRAVMSTVLTRNGSSTRWSRVVDGDWIWTIPSPLRVAGPCDSRLSPNTGEALALRKLLGSRLPADSALAGQLSLSSAIVAMRAESASDLDPTSFVPSPDYPAATRALMQLQCAELFPKPAEHGLPLIERIVADLPALARSLEWLKDDSRCFGHDTPALKLLAEETGRFSNEQSKVIARLHPQPDLSDPAVLLHWVALPAARSWGSSSYPGNLGEILSKPDLATNLAKLRDLHTANGYDPAGTDRHLLVILTAAGLGQSEPSLGIARRLADADPAYLEAVNLLLLHAMTLGDRETITRRFANAVAAGLPNLLHLHAPALNCLQPEDFARILAVLVHAPDLAPFAQPVGTMSNGIPGFLTAVNLRAPGFLDRAYQSLRPRMTPSDRAAYSMEWFLLARNEPRPASPQPCPPAVAIPDADPKAWQIPSVVESAWGYASQRGRGAEVTGKFEELITRQAAATTRLGFHGGAAVAARHATDATWQRILEASEDSAEWLGQDALRAAECYHDGHQQRALEWLKTLASRITEPGTKIANERYPRGVAAADRLARAWLWIGQPDEAEAWVRRFPELENAAEWQPFLRRKALLTENLAIHCRLTATPDRESILHWHVGEAGEIDTGGEGLWPPRALSDKLSARVAIMTDGKANRAIPVELHGINSGTLNLGVLPQRSLVEFEIHDPGKASFWRGGAITTAESSPEFAGTDQVEDLEAAIIQAATAAGMNATVEKQVDFGHSPHVFLRGWLPPGGLEIRSWPCQPGTSAAWGASTVALTGAVGLVMATLPQDKVPGVNPRKLYGDFSGSEGSQAWFTPTIVRFHNLPAQVGNRWVLKLVRADTSPSSFVCVRLVKPQIVFRRLAPPPGTTVLGYFPEEAQGKVVIDPERRLAVSLAANGPAAFSHPLEPAAYARVHPLDYYPPVAGAFTRDAFMLIDQQGYLWQAGLRDPVFRIVGRSGLMVVRMLSGNATTRVALLCEDGTVSLIDSAAPPLKTLATVKLAVGERCWLAPDGAVLAVKPAEDGRIRCFDPATGKELPELDFSGMYPSIRILRFQNNKGGEWEDRGGKPWRLDTATSARNGEDSSPLGQVFGYPDQFRPLADGAAVILKDHSNRLLRVSVPVLPEPHR